LPDGKIYCMIFSAEVYLPPLLQLLISSFFIYWLPLWVFFASASYLLNLFPVYISYMCRTYLVYDPFLYRYGTCR